MAFRAQLPYLAGTVATSSFYYDLGIRAYGLALRAAVPFNPKARAWLKGRQGLLDQIKERFAGNKTDVIWVHCASLGEFEQGRSLMERFREVFPKHCICLTFFSPSGFQVRYNYSGADYIFYLPLDTKENARAFVEAVKPVLAVFVKYEFWYHYLASLSEHNVPAVSVSAIFRPTQHFFKPYGKFYRQLLGLFKHFFVQNEESKELLASIGLSNVTVAGDTRFDRVAKVATQAKDIPLAAHFARGHEVMVIGSSWPADMERLCPFIEEHPKLKFIIAPHEIHEIDLQSIEKRLKTRTVRFSKANQISVERAQVLLVDTIGLLAGLYRYGRYAYIGGAFGKGLHNTLEAAAFGLPLVFGPRYDKFKEAKDLIALEAAISINSVEDLNVAFDRWQNPAHYRKISSAAREYVARHKGATERIISYCQQLLEHHP